MPNVIDIRADEHLRVEEGGADAAAGAVAGVVGHPGYCEASIGQRRDRRARLVAGRSRIDNEVVAQCRAIGTEEPRTDAGAVAISFVKGMPRDDEAAVGKCGDRWVRLVILGRRVDDEVAARGGSVGVVDAAADAVARPVARIVGPPRHDEPAIGQRRDRSIALCALSRRVDDEIVADCGAVGIEDAGADATARAVAGIVGLPSHHEAAIGQRRRRGEKLILRRRRVDDEVAARGGAVGIEDASADATDVTVAGICGLPRDHEASVGKHRRRGPRLIAVAGRIDDEITAGRASIGIVDASADAGAGAVAGVGRPPRGHEAAVGKRSDRGIALIALDGRVYDEVVARGRAVGIVDSGADARPGSVSIVLGLPDYHNAAVCKLHYR